MTKKEQVNKFWRFNPVNSATGSPAELILYGDISSVSWWGDEVTPKQFSNELKSLGDVSEIVVRINSGGGDVFAANAIYTRLKDHKAHITVKIDGWAASAATIIAMAGDEIQIPSNGVFMIHDPKIGIMGYYGKDDFVKLSDELKVVKQSIVNGYVLKTGKTSEEISGYMEKETWYDGKQAVENGFCDKLMFEEADAKFEDSNRIIVNSVSFDITRYSNMPKALLNNPTVNNSGRDFLYSKLINGKENNDMIEIKTVDELKAAYPDLVNEIREEAVIAERERIKSIEDIALNGFENIAQDAKFKNPISASDVAMRIIAEQKKQGKNFLENREEDVKDGNLGDVKAESSENGSNTENPFDAAIDKVLPLKD